MSEGFKPQKPKGRKSQFIASALTLLAVGLIAIFAAKFLVGALSILLASIFAVGSKIKL